MATNPVITGSAPNPEAFQFHVTTQPVSDVDGAQLAYYSVRVVGGVQHVCLYESVQEDEDTEHTKGNGLGFYVTAVFTDDGSSGGNELDRLTSNTVTVNITGFLDPADVRNEVDMGGALGTLVVPDAQNVRSGVGFDSSGSQTGTLTLPDPADVRAGSTQYGGDGTEFTGTLSAGGGGGRRQVW